MTLHLKWVSFWTWVINLKGKSQFKVLVEGCWIEFPVEVAYLALFIVHNALVVL